MIDKCVNFYFKSYILTTDALIETVEKAVLKFIINVLFFIYLSLLEKGEVLYAFNFFLSF